MLQDNVDITIPNLYTVEIPITVDLDSMIEFSTPPLGTHYGRIYKQITFIKSVRGVVNPQANTYYGAISKQILFTKAVSGVVKKTYYGAIAQQVNFYKGVAGIVSNKKTLIAEVSLAPGEAPSERINNHSIKVRARTVSGSTGILKAALYEGTTRRSSDLITGLLTNVLTDYTLVISDSEAATITDYSNLSIKFWGHDVAGNALVFEIADIYLDLSTINLPMPLSLGDTNG